MSLEDIGHLDLPSSFSGRRRFTAADHSGLYIVPAEPFQRDAVLRIEALRLHQVAVGIWDQKQSPIRQHAINIHQEHLNAGSDFVELFLIKRRVQQHEASELRPGFTMSVLADSLLDRVAQIITRY